MTIPALNLSRAIDLTLTALRANTPVLCHGSPGIGKSQGWATQVAQKLNATLHTFIPSHHDPVAINGLPAPDNETKTTKTYMTEFFSDILTRATADPGTNHLIFLDELGQASPAHQAPLMELIHEKRVAGRTLPENCYIIAATNKLSDQAMTQRMATPLRNRFIHFELIPDRSAWLDWLNSASANASIPQHLKTLLTGFLEFKPDSFYTFDAKRSDIFTFATPRSWSALTRLLAEHPDTNKTPLPPQATDTIHVLALSSVGEPVASDLAAFAATYTKLPAMQDIEAGRDPSLDTSDPAVLYALTTALIERLRDRFINDKTTEDTPAEAVETQKEIINNLHAYAMKHLHKDLQAWLVKSLYGDRELQKNATRAFKHWQTNCVRSFISENIDLLV